MIPASATTILDRELLGLRIDELEKAPTRIGGVGGLVDTYIAGDAEIILKTLRVNMWKCSMCLS